LSSLKVTGVGADAAQFDGDLLQKPRILVA
jgi:hypothetical protein